MIRVGHARPLPTWHSIVRDAAIRAILATLVHVGAIRDGQASLRHSARLEAKVRHAPIPSYYGHSPTAA